MYPQGPTTIAWIRATRWPGFSAFMILVVVAPALAPHAPWVRLVSLGEDLGHDIFRVASVEAPPFSELLSTVTLATLPPSGDGGPPSGRRSGDRLMMTFSSGAATSGHTTGVDWANIGNVGDTFYGLFYKDEPATGLTPAFIRDAVYYARWSAEEFGSGWASADWLSTAADSRKEDGKTPDGIAREGRLTDVIADIFPAAATRDFSDRGEKEDEGSRKDRTDAFSAMGNFEVKKRGPMAVKQWHEIGANTAKMKGWFVNARSGSFIKLRGLLPPEVQEKL